MSNNVSDFINLDKLNIFSELEAMKSEYLEKTTVEIRLFFRIRLGISHQLQRTWRAGVSSPASSSNHPLTTFT